jgi:arylsulfatase A-like enzyme
MDLHRRARILSLSHPGELMKVGALGGPEVGDRYLGFLKEAYGSEVARVDDSLRAIFETLEIGDEDLVVVVADHGEEFMDHGAVGHRWLRSLHEELVRVPLVVRLPHGRAGGTVVDTPVSIVDLVPTILDAAGLRTDGCSGRSLLPIIVDGDRREVALHGELTEPAADVRFRLVYPWKYVHDFSMDRGELFNLADDPAEARDLSPVHPARAAAMKDALLEWMEATGPRWEEVETVPLSSQEIERLRAMGYLM